MGDTQVLHRVEWPHESVYTVDNKPAEYEALTILLFVSSYIRIMDAQKTGHQGPDVSSSDRAYGRCCAIWMGGRSNLSCPYSYSRWSKDGHLEKMQTSSYHFAML